jgi:hypothetical protein
MLPIFRLYLSMIAIRKTFRASSTSLLLALGIAPAGAGSPDVNSGEFLNNPYLQGISVIPAWDAGLLGNGVVIANLDSGVRANHVDLAGTILPGYDFVNDDDDPFDDEKSLTYGHGTASSGIIVGIWNGVGIGGIAPNARIMPIKITNEENKPDGGLISQGMLYAAKQSNVKIILLENVGPSTTLAEFNTFNEAVNAGKLLIAPSGNNGLSGPVNPASQFSALGGAALVVGSNNGAGGRSAFSNGASGVEGNYLTAPGEGILAAGNQGDDFYYTVSGTSMAAPQVAAAAALIWSYAPSLTATEVAEILKKSATDLGAPGVDSIFGAGGLNIEAALAPIGIITAPIEEEEEEEEEEDGSGDSSDESGSSGGAGVALAALVLGGVGYALIRNNPDLDETLVLDEYGRTYELDLETRISVRNPGPSAESVLQELDTEQVNETLIQRSDFKLTASYRFDQRTSYLDPYIDDQEDDQTVKMQLTAFDQTGAQYAFGFNQRLPSFFNNMGASQNLPLTTGFFRSDAFSAPVMGFSNLGYHSSVGFRSETGWQSGLAFSSVDDEMRHGLKSESSSFHLGLKQKGFRVGLQLGFLEEDGNLLGGASHGALSVSRAQTVFGAARGDIALNNHWSMVGQYTHGVTWADDYAASLVSDFSTIESNSWGFGLLGRDLLSKGDAFGVALSQPLRTIDGDARVSTPYWNQSVGGINFNTRRTSLVPDGTEHSIELFYRKSISRNVRFISYLIYRDQPLHEHKTESHASVVSAVSWGFGMH